MNWKQSLRQTKTNILPLELFYKRLPNRATYTMQEVIRGLRGYDVKEVMESLEYHGCIIWEGRLVVFTHHPKKYKR